MIIFCMRLFKFSVFMACILPIYTFAMPAYPMAFWGNVTIDGNPASVGTVISAYDTSSKLLGNITVLENGIYGYNNSFKQKLLIAEGVGTITFKFKKNNEIEKIGCNTITYPSFVQGLTEEKKLAFKTVGCSMSPDNNGVATLSTTTNQVIITNRKITTSITINSDTSDPTIDISSFISNGVGILPAINIAAVNANNVTVAISASTTVTSASTTWDGIISAPKVINITLPVESGQTKITSTAIEVGLTDMKLTFDKAVKIILPNQVGKRVGYTRMGSAFTEITNVCVSLTDQVAINNDLVDLKEECKIDSGSDIVIWTKHFTTFASYTQSANSSTSSGGGGFLYITHNITPANTEVINKVKPHGEILGEVAYNFLNNLKIKSTGSDVIELQKILISEGFLNYKVTGYFGALTKTALIKWQTKNNLPVTGIFDSNSRYFLTQKTETSTTNTSTRKTVFVFLKDLRIGMRDANVIELQKVLIAEGLLNSEATGYFGSQTKTALVKWQTKNNLPATGYFGPMTRSILNKK